MYFSLFFKIFLNFLEDSRTIKKIKKLKFPKILENSRIFKNSPNLIEILVKFREFFEFSKKELWQTIVFSNFALIFAIDYVNFWVRPEKGVKRPVL